MTFEEILEEQRIFNEKIITEFVEKWDKILAHVDASELES